MIERLLENKEVVLATLGQPNHKHKLELLAESEWDELRVLHTLVDAVPGQNGRGQNGTDKMVRTKWHGQNGSNFYRF